MKRHCDETIFLISQEDLQEEAFNLVGRKLTDNELRVAIKGINEGLSFGIDTIFCTAIEEAVSTA
jgi:hypothetical protein